MKSKKAVIVYQVGIANVFQVSSFNAADYGRNARRLLQHAFSPCEWFARGLEEAGWTIKAMVCNMAGDVTHQPWSTEIDDAPFRESMSLSARWCY